MDIHEYQAKEILARFGVPVPQGGLAYSPEQAAYRAHEIGGRAWVVKAQVHTGGRGRVGGVRLCHSENEVFDAANEMFGKRIVTTQTGAEGKVVYRVWVEGAARIATEHYIGFVLDRMAERIVMVASRKGGIEIEDIAAEAPDTILRSVIEPAVGLTDFQAREIAFGLKLAPEQIGQAVKVIRGCYKAFTDLDATMVEVNPLVVTETGEVVALDARMSFDDNALFRRPEIAELRDKSQENPRETRAADRGLSYIGMEGRIGILVNGAGLALATMDMLEAAGGKPANFMDIGGGASPERVAKAIRLVRSDPNVEALLVNIFAGINRCDWVAEGIVSALEAAPPDIPIVVRLAGTNLEAGRKILAQSGLPVIRAGSLAEAAARTVAAWKKART